MGFNGSGSWTILSPIEQSIKAKIESVGIPLKEWNISINYGIKTGLNDAFIVDGQKKDELIATDQNLLRLYDRFCVAETLKDIVMSTQISG